MCVLYLFKTKRNLYVLFVRVYRDHIVSVVECNAVCCLSDDWSYTRIRMYIVYTHNVMRVRLCSAVWPCF